MTLDFWDLTKVLCRRWRISVPMLLLTAVVAGLTLTHAGPAYVSTAYVELVPPMPIGAPAGGSTSNQRNPWLAQDMSTLATAAMIAVLDVTYIQSLKAAGYSEKVTGAVDGHSSLVTFAVTGATRRQAEETASAVVARFDQSLTSLQTDYGVADRDLITGRRLDGGANTVVSTSRAKRAIAVVVGLGLLITAAVAAGVDVRQRRRAQAAGVGAMTVTPSEPPPSEAPDAPVDPAVVIHGASGSRVARHSPSVVVDQQGRPASGAVVLPAGSAKARMAPSEWPEGIRNVRD